jgi:hypothetical protein
VKRQQRPGVPPPLRPRPLPLAVQLRQLIVAVPGSAGRLTAGRLLWSGVVTPCKEADTYELLIDHRLRGAPRVHVISPLLSGPGPIPHTYNTTRPCLYVPGTWYDNLSLAKTILPWSLEWLLYYELWSAGGDWQGGGIHPEDRPFSATRFGQRTRLRKLRFERETKKERLRLIEGHQMLRRGAAVVALPQNLPGDRHRGPAPAPRANDVDRAA